MPSSIMVNDGLTLPIAGHFADRAANIFVECHVRRNEYVCCVSHEEQQIWSLTAAQEEANQFDVKRLSTEAFARVEQRSYL